MLLHICNVHSRSGAPHASLLPSFDVIDGSVTASRREWFPYPILSLNERYAAVCTVYKKRRYITVTYSDKKNTDLFENTRTPLKMVKISGSSVKRSKLFLSAICTRYEDILIAGPLNDAGFFVRWLTLFSSRSRCSYLQRTFLVPFVACNHATRREQALSFAGSHIIIRRFVVRNGRHENCKTLCTSKCVYRCFNYWPYFLQLVRRTKIEYNLNKTM